MQTEFKAQLEKKIDEWLQKNCDKMVKSDEDVGYFYTELVKDMASAAKLVFDASMKGQKFLKDNG